MSIQSVLYLVPQQRLSNGPQLLREVAECLGLNEFSEAYVFESGLQEEEEDAMALLEELPAALSVTRAVELVHEYREHLVHMTVCKKEAEPILQPVREVIQSMGSEGAGWMPFDVCIDVGDQSFLDEEEDFQLWRGNISVSLFGDGAPYCGSELILERLRESESWHSVVNRLRDAWQSEVQQYLVSS